MEGPTDFIGDSEGVGDVIGGTELRAQVEAVARGIKGRPRDFGQRVFDDLADWLRPAVGAHQAEFHVSAIFRDKDFTELGDRHIVDACQYWRR